MDWFPDGLVIDFDGSKESRNLDVAPRIRRGILYDSLDFVRGRRTSKKNSDYETTALSVAGEIVLIFMARTAGNRKLRARWRALLKTLNIRAAIGTAPSYTRNHARAKLLL